MTGIARALVAASPQQSSSDFVFSNLRVFTRIPEHHHDVTALLGLVLVYETDSFLRDGIQDGTFYVVENQRPVAGMSWEIYDQFNRRHGQREPRVRIETSRNVIRAMRDEKGPDHWWQVLPSGFRDGPFLDWSVTHNIVGKVLGIYRPADGSHPDGGDRKPGSPV